MDQVREAMRKRYDKLHPLLFERSAERAKSDVELFDIMESLPAEYPVVWDDDSRRWKHTPDLLQSEALKRGVT